MPITTGRSGALFFGREFNFNRIRGRRILSRSESKESSFISVPSLQDRSSESSDLISTESISDALTNEEELQRKLLWKGAIKLPMYWVAILPVLVGSAVAYYHSGVFNFSKIFQLLFGSISIIAWLNLSNDVFDHETGVDVSKAESIVNLTGDKSMIHGLSFAFLSVGLVLIGRAILQIHSNHPIWMLLTSILCGYIYQGPPFRLSYKGLGEPLCFLAFGPLATTAFYLVMSGSQSLFNLPAECWTTSILVGLTTTIILFCSHFHQFDSDLSARKFSPVVQLGGPENALKVLIGSLLSTMVLILIFVFMGWLPKALMFVLWWPVLMAIRCGQYAHENISILSKLRFLKLYAIDLHSSCGISLILVFMLSRQIFAH